MDKKESRIRRGRRTRAKIRELGVHRLSVYRTPRHIYAQVISADGSKVLASASTLDKAVQGEINGATGNASAASVVGKFIAERAKTAGVESVAFDRSGFRFHGRVKALADAAREAGLQF
ncbi:MAG: 50S ribosomal protein L18 [Candidatus Thiodiazotropha sp. (ex Notomyrtea botanica)]|nr:50S ribosomal protein L18 [Candidatus Thiodiazotropha sp. (ex Notomyrtea botanica)]